LYTESRSILLNTVITNLIGRVIDSYSHYWSEYCTIIALGWWATI